MKFTGRNGWSNGTGVLPPAAAIAVAAMFPLAGPEEYGFAVILDPSVPRKFPMGVLLPPPLPSAASKCVCRGIWLDCKAALSWPPDSPIF